MKLMLLSFLMAAAAVAEDGVLLSGKWQIQRSAAGRDSRQVCALTQTKNDLTGSCSSDGGTVTVTGTVDGKKVTWKYKGDSEGGPVTVVYKGTVESATKITGIVSAVEFGIDGEFTATAVK